MNENLTQDQAESIISKIKKLMALSKSSNENESAAAAAKAQELLLKYNVEMSQISNTEVETKLLNEFFELFDKNEIRWKLHLAHSCAKANLCFGVSSGKGIYFLGRKHNIEIAQYMYETTANDLERIAEEKWQQILHLRDLQAQFPQVHLFSDPSLEVVHGKTWKASFYVGAVKTIRERLEENLNELTINNDNMMALVTTEKQQLKVFVDQQFPRLTNGQAMRYNYRNAFESGRRAGQDIQFRRGVGAGGSYSGGNLLGEGKK
jgi:hypothetical protein